MGGMTHREKIQTLASCLNGEPQNYRDSFKPDLCLFFNDDFSLENPCMDFLHPFETTSDIEEWVALVTSHIVLKFDEEVESLGDFVGEYLEVELIK
ncbi:MAG: hypothetical protein CL666_00435 [Balneola sp.]|nr:hypothetical protein [Balneola sp.]|tara:strand:+ start:240 stop:527 length:288 start_codon:yes stop_codon:yes gene_type:complete